MIRGRDGRNLVLSGPNPLVHPTVIEAWSIDDLAYKNWDSFAPIVGRSSLYAKPTAVTYIHRPQQEQQHQEPVVFIQQNTEEHHKITPAKPPQVTAGRILYFYQIKNRNMFDSLYRERKGNVLEEKPISIRVIGEEDDMLKVDKTPFIESNVGLPMSGSRILDDSQNKRYMVIDSIVKEDCILIEVELENR